MSWSARKGLELYLEDTRVDVDENPATNELDYNSSERFFIGRANTDMRREHYTNGIFDNVEFWQTTRQVLNSTGFLSEGQRDRVQGFCMVAAVRGCLNPLLKPLNPFKLFASFADSE